MIWTICTTERGRCYRAAGLAREARKSWQEGSLCRQRRKTRPTSQIQSLRRLKAHNGDVRRQLKRTSIALYKRTGIPVRVAPAEPSARRSRTGSALALCIALTVWRVRGYNTVLMLATRPKVVICAHHFLPGCTSTVPSPGTEHAWRQPPPPVQGKSLLRSYVRKAME